MAAPDRIILGSRGSELARAQARLVEAALHRVYPGIAIETKYIQTRGDESQRAGPISDRKAGRKGMFTRAIEKELLGGRIDLAVHSAKDLPSEQPGELEICATLPRGNTDDILIARENFHLTTLPPRATIATGSVRRQRQLRFRRPDLKIVDLHGNVPTRLRKLRENGDWAGIILARIGLERLGLEWNGAILAKEDFLPAGGQAIIALQIRREDQAVRDALDAINHLPTHRCLRAEREFLRMLNGDCDTPVGVQAEISNDRLEMRAQVFDQAEAPQMSKASGPVTEPEKVAAELMRKIHGQ